MRPEQLILPGRAAFAAPGVVNASSWNLFVETVDDFA